MGAFGTGLFADDEAMDVRALYRDLRTFGISGEEAVVILKDQCGIGDALNPEDGVFYLATAQLLWKDGRLPDSLREIALRIIDERTDLHRWNDTKTTKKRAAVLTKLARQLRSPMPAPAKLPPYFSEHTAWEPGEIIAFRHQSGRYALLRVVGHFTRLGGKSPILEVLDWHQDTIPPESVITKLPLMQARLPELDIYLSGADKNWERWKTEGQLAMWPKDVTLEEYKSTCFLHPTRPLIRSAEGDRAFKKAQRLEIYCPSPRRFFPSAIPSNSWRTWSDFDKWTLTSDFGSAFPSHDSKTNDYNARQNR